MIYGLRIGGPGSARQAVEATEEELRAVYELIYTRAFTAFARETFEGFEATRSVKQDEGLLAKWLRLAREFVASRPVDRRIKQVQETTIQWVNKLTSEGLREGLSVDQIATQIEDKWTDPESGINRWRAERIARTETISAANAGTMQGARSAVDEYGLNMKRFWISTFDGRTREGHDTRLEPELAEARGMDEPYMVRVRPGEPYEQLQFPGDPAGSPANVIQCRCVEGYEVLE